MAEDLDHLLSGHDLLHIAVELADLLLLGDKIGPAQARQLAGSRQHKTHHSQGDQGQGNIQQDHTEEDTDDGESAVNQLGNALTEHLPQGIDVIGIDGHNIPMGMGIKIADGKLLHMGK